jgi:hypothetical protein
MNTTQTMTRVEINRELTELRFAREKAQREVDNIQACMNALMQKRNDLDFELKHGDLFTAMFGDDDGRGQDSAFMDDNFGG